MLDTQNPAPWRGYKQERGAKSETSFLQVFQSFGGLSDYPTTHVDAGAFPKNPHSFIEPGNGQGAVNDVVSAPGAVLVLSLSGRAFPAVLHGRAIHPLARPALGQYRQAQERRMLLIIGAGNHRICIATLDASKEKSAGLTLDVLQ